MIVAYLGFLLIAVLVFVLTGKLALPIRMAVGLAVFLIPSIALTVWIARVGDKPPGDAVTVVPKPTGIDKADSHSSGNSKK
jgi:hypothetical protein